jgi:8-oxo-dGTP pyrophosphatase MutT (NUDIX family)
MTSPVIHRITTLDLAYRPSPWAFAEQRRAEIDAHFAQKQREKPGLFNGRVLLGRNPVFAGAHFSAEYFDTDFASFLAWRDFGGPDEDVFNGFGMGALRSSDGAYLLGEMSAGTANGGRIYFPAGTPDLDDLRGDTVDLAGSVAREVGEETGLEASDYVAAEDWYAVVTPRSIALMRVLDVAMPAEALRRRIEANLAGQVAPELSAMHLVRGVDDFTATMPVFVTAFIAAQLVAAA